MSRPEFLDLAQACGAEITGKPDGTESVNVVFAPAAWRMFDQMCLQRWPEGGTIAHATGESMIIELKDDVKVDRGDGTFYVAQRGRKVNYHCKRKLNRDLIHEFSVWEARTGVFHKHTQVSQGDTAETGRPTWL